MNAAFSVTVTTYKRGDLVLLGDRQVFKVGLVIGPSRVEGKLRVRSFSASAKAWSHPFTMEVAKLGQLPAPTVLHGWRSNVVRWAQEMAGAGL